jgi:protein-tyrosine kinase
MRLPFRRAKAKLGGGDLDTWPSLENLDAFVRHPAVVATVERAPSSASVHELGNMVLESHFAQGRRGLAICGVTADSGALDVASSLSVALSMQDVRVLLVDTSFSLPHLANTSGARPGLSDVLSKKDVRVESVIETGILPRLDLLSCGSTPVPDLLEGEQFSRFAREVLRLYDCTIVCAPPANRCSTALSVARSMGHAVIVARASRTFYEDLVQLSGDLRKDGVQILGSVMIDA